MGNSAPGEAEAVFPAAVDIEGRRALGAEESLEHLDGREVGLLRIVLGEEPAQLGDGLEEHGPYRIRAVTIVTSSSKSGLPDSARAASSSLR